MRVTEGARPRPANISQRESSKPSEDRTGYRRTGGPGADKKAEVGAGTAEMEFVSFIFRILV